MTGQPDENHQSTGGFNTAACVVHKIDPVRLAMGRWDASQEQHVGEGDIYASYSADCIAMTGKVRRPFMFRGLAWVCTSNCGVATESQSTAYRLVPLDGFEGEPVTYAEKTGDCGAARADPDGFYHGIEVLHCGQLHVLVGPPVHFVSGTQPQPGLFAGM